MGRWGGCVGLPEVALPWLGTLGGGMAHDCLPPTKQLNWFGVYDQGLSFADLQLFAFTICFFQLPSQVRSPVKQIWNGS